MIGVKCSHFRAKAAHISGHLPGVAAEVKAKALNGAGFLMGLQGDHEQAMVLCEESLALFRESGDTQGTALSLLWLGEITFWTGRLLRSRAQLEEALALFRGLDDTWGITSSLISLASVALEKGEYSRTRSLLEESLAFFREVGNKTRIANALLTWAWMLLWSGGELEKAHSMLEESLALFRKLGHQPTIAFCLENLAGVAVAQGQLSWGVRLLGTVEMLREAIAVSRPHHMRRLYEKYLATARTGLGEEDFAAAWAEGQAMTLEQVLFLRNQLTRRGKCLPAQ